MCLTSPCYQALSWLKISSNFNILEMFFFFFVIPFIFFIYFYLIFLIFVLYQLQFLFKNHNYYNFFNSFVHLRKYCFLFLFLFFWPAVVHPSLQWFYTNMFRLIQLCLCNFSHQQFQHVGNKTCGKRLAFGAKEN